MPGPVARRDPTAFSLTEELFGPFLSVHVYDDAEWDRTLDE
ncbi:hypothetical protein [Saccharopolyspora hattusasensis]